MIVQLCSSALLRPNGITRYINTLMNFHREQNYSSILISDSRPTVPIDTVSIYTNDQSLFVPNVKNNHPWIQIDNGVINDCKKVIEKVDYKKVSMVVAHDLHSYLAAKEIVPAHITRIFIQHESDVLNPNHRFSYLSDEYLNKQIEEGFSTDWVFGMTANSNYRNFPTAKYFPVPFTVDKSRAHIKKSRDVVFVGEANERKGIDSFIHLKEQPREYSLSAVSWDVNDDAFQGIECKRFELDQYEQLLDFIASHKVAYIGSKSETLSLALLECLQYIPTVVNSDWQWTQAVQGTGAKICTVDDTHRIICDLLKDYENYSPDNLNTFSVSAKKIWTEVLQ